MSIPREYTGDHLEDVGEHDYHLPTADAAEPTVGPNGLPEGCDEVISGQHAFISEEHDIVPDGNLAHAFREVVPPSKLRDMRSDPNLLSRSNQPRDRVSTDHIHQDRVAGKKRTHNKAPGNRETNGTNWRADLVHDAVRRADSRPLDKIFDDSPRNGRWR